MNTKTIVLKYVDNSGTIYYKHQLFVFLEKSVEVYTRVSNDLMKKKATYRIMKKMYTPVKFNKDEGIGYYKDVMNGHLGGKWIKVL